DHRWGLDISVAYDSRLELVTVRLRNMNRPPWVNPSQKDVTRIVYLTEAWVGVSSKQSIPGFNIVPCGFMAGREADHENVAGFDIYSGLHRGTDHMPVITGVATSKTHFALVGGESITWRFRVLSEDENAVEMPGLDYFGLE